MPPSSEWMTIGDGWQKWSVAASSAVDHHRQTRPTSKLLSRTTMHYKLPFTCKLICVNASADLDAAALVSDDSFPSPSSSAASCPFINHNYMSEHLFSPGAFQFAFDLPLTTLEADVLAPRDWFRARSSFFLCPAAVHSLVVSGTKRGQLYILPSAHCSPSGHQSWLSRRRIDFLADDDSCPRGLSPVELLFGLLLSTWLVSVSIARWMTWLILIAASQWRRIAALNGKAYANRPPSTRADVYSLSGQYQHRHHWQWYLPYFVVFFFHHNSVDLIFLFALCFANLSKLWVSTK